MGRYGKNMRDCCDSPVGTGPHVTGCAPATLTDRELLVEALAWLRGGDERLHCRFSTYFGLERALAERVGDVRDDS